MVSSCLLSTVRSRMSFHLSLICLNKTWGTRTLFISHERCVQGLGQQCCVHLSLAPGFIDGSFPSANVFLDKNCNPFSFFFHLAGSFWWLLSVCSPAPLCLFLSLLTKTVYNLSGAGKSQLAHGTAVFPADRYPVCWCLFGLQRHTEGSP